MSNHEKNILLKLQQYAHPNIIPFYGRVSSRENDYLMMEMAAKGSLDNLVKQKQVRLDTVCKLSICMQVASAMEALSSLKACSSLLAGPLGCTVESR